MRHLLATEPLPDELPGLSPEHVARLRDAQAIYRPYDQAGMRSPASWMARRFEQLMREGVE